MKKLTLGFITLILVTFAANAGSFSTTQYIEVEKSKPKYKNITHRTPYQECWNERVAVRRQGHRRENSNDAVSTLVGGLAGGVLGNQVGKGRGNTLATIGGALVGSLVGNNLSNNNHNNNSYTTYETQRRCATHYNERREKKFIGYKNIGFFRGHKIVKFSQKRLNYIPVTITVSY